MTTEVDWHIGDIVDVRLGGLETTRTIVVVGPDEREFALREDFLGRDFERTHVALRELIPKRTRVVNETDDEPKLAELEVASESTTSPSG